LVTIISHHYYPFTVFRTGTAAATSDFRFAPLDILIISPNFDQINQIGGFLPTGDTLGTRGMSTLRWMFMNLSFYSPACCVGGISLYLSDWPTVRYQLPLAERSPGWRSHVEG